MSASRPGFLRRHPFPWVLAASIVFGWGFGLYATDRRWRAESDIEIWLCFALEAAAILFVPALVAAWWRRIGRVSRVVGGAVAALWLLTLFFRFPLMVREIWEYAPKMRVVREMLRAPRQAMQVPPEVAARRDVAAGRAAFLAVGGQCASVPGVQHGQLARLGVRVVSGTYHDGPPLTPVHGSFISRARDYAWTYNYTTATELGIREEPTDSSASCLDPGAMRRASGRYFWP